MSGKAERSGRIGRPPGARNKNNLSKDMKMLLENEIYNQGAKGVARFPKEHPVEFWKIASKLIPLQIDETITVAQIVAPKAVTLFEWEKYQEKHLNEVKVGPLPEKLAMQRVRENVGDSERTRPVKAESLADLS